MDIQTILLSALSIVITALVTWGTERLIALINSKIKNTKYAKYLADSVDIVSRAVKTTYQTYVEALKDKNMFTSDAQVEALNKAKDIAISQLSTEMKTFIESNFGDMEKWLTSTIESVIYDLKKKNKGETSNENT